MRHILSGHKHLSLTALLLTSIALGSCSAPDRLRNDDMKPEAVKELVRERLIAPIDDERAKEFNERIPRRSLLQVIHGPDSLSDPSFIRLIENQLSDEIRFKLEQQEEAPKPVSLPAEETGELSDEEKAKIKNDRAEAKEQLLFNRAVELEGLLAPRLDELQIEKDNKLDAAIPIGNGASAFPEIIGANLSEDENGYLSFPADVFLIGGQDSRLVSKTAILEENIQDFEFNLTVRELPLKDVLTILSSALGLEYTFSAGVENEQRIITMSVKAGALSILDALLTQNDLAIIYDAERSIAGFHTEDEVSSIRDNVRDAIAGYNNLRKNKLELEKTEADITKVREMMDISQLLFNNDIDGFLAGTKGFPRTGLGIIARAALKDLTDTQTALKAEIKRFDDETVALLNPETTVSTGNISSIATNRALSDILVEDKCIKLGEEIFVEKIAVYNAIVEETIDHLDTFFPGNNDAETAPAEEPVVAIEEEADDEAADAEQEGNEEESVLDECPTTYATRFQEDATGIIARGRRSDNSLAIRLIEAYDVPRLQVLVEIFMVTVSRDFDRRVANLITQLRNGQGGSGTEEAQLLNTTTTTPSVNNLNSDFLTGISSAISNGYAVNLRSPTGVGNLGYISSALSFLESNELGRVLSSPTILVEHGKEASITRELVAAVEFPLDAPDNSTDATPQTELVELSAPFSLSLSDVNVNPSNLTVQLEVEIENKVFSRAIEAIADREDADYTTDKIETTFTTAPGDVIVLAGLSSNSESSLTEGLPGTSDLGLAAPLLGGSDRVTANFSEMIIFLAPTVIDPSSDFQPHSAF